jgi:hypothetical protein
VTVLIGRRMAAIAALLWHRTAQAEDASAMAAHQMVGQAEALDTRLPKLAGLPPGQLGSGEHVILSDPVVNVAHGDG